MDGISRARSGRSWAALSIVGCILAAASAGCGGGGGGGGTSVTTSNISAGTWGSSNAEVDTTSSSSKLILNCATNNLPAIAVNSSGNYSFNATYTNPPTAIANAQYTGNVSGTTMTMTITDPKTNLQIDSYTMTFGQTKPPFTGVCTGQ